MLSEEETEPKGVGMKIFKSSSPKSLFVWDLLLKRHNIHPDQYRVISAPGYKVIIDGLEARFFVDEELDWICEAQE